MGAYRYLVYAAFPVIGVHQYLVRSGALASTSCECVLHRFIINKLMRYNTSLSTPQHRVGSRGARL